MNLAAFRRVVFHRLVRLLSVQFFNLLIRSPKRSFCHPVARSKFCCKTGIASRQPGAAFVCEAVYLAATVGFVGG